MQKIACCFLWLDSLIWLQWDVDPYLQLSVLSFLCVYVLEMRECCFSGSTGWPSALQPDQPASQGVRTCWHMLIGGKEIKRWHLLWTEHSDWRSMPLVSVRDYELAEKLNPVWDLCSCSCSALWVMKFYGWAHPGSNKA